eukprot:873727_1
MTSTLDTYQKQLNEINSIPTPKVLFNKIDTLIKSYQSLKRQYTAEYSTYHQYDSKIRNYISKSPHKSNNSIPISTKDIQKFINKMKKLQFSFYEWVQNVNDANNANTKSDGKNNFKSKPDTNSLFVTTTKNIKPSRAKKRRSSNSSTKSIASNISTYSNKSAPPIKIKKSKSKMIIEPIPSTISIQTNSISDNSDDFNFDYKNIVNNMQLDTPVIDSHTRRASCRT